MVLVLLVISILMVVAFFYWETRIPEEKAAMYVIGNFRMNIWLILYQTTPDVVLRQLLRPHRRCTLAIFLVEHAVLDFYELMARYLSLVGNIDGHTHVRSSLSLHDAHR